MPLEELQVMGAEYQYCCCVEEDLNKGSIPWLVKIIFVTIFLRVALISVVSIGIGAFRILNILLHRLLNSYLKVPKEAFFLSRLAIPDWMWVSHSPLQVFKLNFFSIKIDVSIFVIFIITHMAYKVGLVFLSPTLHIIALFSTFVIFF